jgi:pyruvate dehydrogenase E1 component
MSTRPIDQAPFNEAAARTGTDRLRRDVLAGGYRLREPGSGEPLILAASGPVIPEVLAAAELLTDEGAAVTVLDITSLDRLYQGWQRALTRATRTSTVPTGTGHIEGLIRPDERSAPIVTIHDAASHSMAWLGSVYGQRAVPIGVDRFGESGTIHELYESFGFLAHQVATAGLVALNLDQSRTNSRSSIP